MKMGIIGAGNIGGTLGQKWAFAGYEVRFGVRDPNDPEYADLHRVGSIGDVCAAVSFGEVVVLALPSGAVASFASTYAGVLAGKIIIDATNDFSRPVMNSLNVLAEVVPGARLVRAFNTLGWENFANPVIGGMQIDLFFCGDPSVRSSIEELITAVGLNPVYIGGTESAALLDGITRLWVTLARGQGYGRRIAFKLLEER
jgi:8-hydroxy-5-deazaflavin:NADPH oxidoreductase